MKRVVFHAPDEMAQAIEELAAERRAPVASVIREAVEEFFAKRGIEFESRVAWGKPTQEADTKESSEEGQIAAVATG